MHLLDLLLEGERFYRVFLIDNSETKDEDYLALSVQHVEYIFNGKNLGYGRAHNIALRKSIETQADYHLVINSDIHFDPIILTEIEQFMNSHSDVGLLMPRVVDPTGQMQHLCKLLPTPFDLIGRRFLPQSCTQKRMQRFEMHDADYSKIINAPYLSGCFMFLRMEAIERVGMFDERFFLYPEDIDLTRRIHREYKTIYYPKTTITHDHARGSYHSLKLLWVHITNMCRYFNKYGWIFDCERRQVNRQTIQDIRPHRM